MSAHAADPPVDKLLQATLDILWRQWRAIGGAAAGGPVTRQVDPEALCIASLVLERHEPRLWVAMTDWFRLGSSLLSVQRLRNLAAQFPAGGKLLQHLAGTVLKEARDARFKALLPKSARARPERGTKGRSVPPPKQRSAGPALRGPAALVLRLRAAFGVGVKADLIAFLLGQRLRTSVATAAAALGYSTPTVFRALQDLHVSGFAGSTDQPSAAEYWIDAQRWYSVLDGQDGVAYWGFWREILTYVAAVVTWQEEMGRRTLSEYALGTSLRQMAKDHEPDLVRAGVLDPGLDFPDSPQFSDWRDFHTQLARRILDLV